MTSKLGIAAAVVFGMWLVFVLSAWVEFGWRMAVLAFVVPAAVVGSRWALRSAPAWVGTVVTLGIMGLGSMIALVIAKGAAAP